MSIGIKGAGELSLEMQQKREEAIAKFKEDFPESNEVYESDYQLPLPYTPTQGYAHAWDSFTNEPRNTFYEKRN